METIDYFEKNVPDWHNKTILVVEDDLDSSQLIHEILKPTGVMLENAIDGVFAVEMCHNKKIDLVLMDIMLPRMTGLDATRRIKKDQPDMVVIAQTAYATIDDGAQCYEAGCDDYMAKPLQVNQLLDIIYKHLK